jgi:glutathione S-transferase
VELLTIISLLAVIQFVVFGAFVGAARGRTGLKAPAVTGDEQFERYFRAHYNTLEQLVAFLPGLWAFGALLNVSAAAGLGLVYLIGRVVYFRAYVTDPTTRGIGMLLSTMPTYVLLLGGLGAAAWRLVPH